MQILKNKHAVETLFIILLCILAFIIRYINISDIPYGAAWDETFYLSVIHKITHGDFVGIFVYHGHMPDGSGWWEMKQPTGFMYVAAPVFKIFGSLESVRAVSAFFGSLLVCAVYLLSKELFGRRIALIASILCIFCLWFMIQSRLAWPVTTSMFLFIFSAYLLIFGEKRNITYIIIAAIVFASGMYVHKLYVPWFVFGLLALCIGCLSYKDLRNKNIFLFLLLSFVLSLPIIFEYIVKFDLYNYLAYHYHSNIVESPSVYNITSQFVKVLFLYHFQPIETNRLDGTGNIALLTLTDTSGTTGYTLLYLHWLSCVLYWIGLAASLIFIKKRNFQLLLVLYLVSTSSGIITPGAEGRRLILAMVFVIIYISIGSVIISEIISKTIRKIFSIYYTKTIVYSLVAMLLLSVFIFQQFRAFDYWIYGQHAEWSFSVDAVQFGKDTTVFADDYRFILYSYRHHENTPTITWFNPYINLENGKKINDRDIDIDNIQCERKTVISLFDNYLKDIEQISNHCQNGTAYYKQHDKKNELLYILYVID